MARFEWISCEKRLVLEACRVSNVTAQIGGLWILCAKLVEQDSQNSCLTGKGHINHAVPIEIGQLDKWHRGRASLTRSLVARVHELAILTGEAVHGLLADEHL